MMPYQLCQHYRKEQGRFHRLTEPIVTEYATLQAAAYHQLCLCTMGYRPEHFTITTEDPLS